MSRCEGLPSFPHKTFGHKWRHWKVPSSPHLSALLKLVNDLFSHEGFPYFAALLFKCFIQACVPLQLAYGIANVVFVSRGLHSFALGLFVTGCAPGGGASNYWTLLLSGNLPVSITMTFVSTVASIGKIYS